MAQVVELRLLGLGFRVEGLTRVHAFDLSLAWDSKPTAGFKVFKVRPTIILGILAGPGT